MTGPQAHWLEDGRRLHLNHGPIDLIVEAFGEAEERRAAYAQAVARFETILAELVSELPKLRIPARPLTLTPQGLGQLYMAQATPTPSRYARHLSPSKGERKGAKLAAGVFSPPSNGGEVDCEARRSGGRPPDATALPQGGEAGDSAASSTFTGSAARRMEAAVLRLAAEAFITPMAAVAGSVADEVLAAMLAGRTLDRAYVNNGGDSALYLAPGWSMSMAIAGTGHGFADRIAIRAEDPVRGVATSGWRGRSFSLGIADAVTVLARCGAEADAAATLIANAVDLPGHPAVTRQPARDLTPDSDLGSRLVTTGVGVLSHDEIDDALAGGLAVAEDFRRRGLIEAAALFLAGRSCVCGHLPTSTNNSTKQEIAYA